MAGSCMICPNPHVHGYVLCRRLHHYDGTVDLTDFTFLASNFNQTLAAGGGRPGSVVPEPSFLLSLSLMVLLRRRTVRH
jgi:hypothetical protein